MQLLVLMEIQVSVMGEGKIAVGYANGLWWWIYYVKKMLILKV
jgi:hypothetical protein